MDYISNLETILVNRGETPEQRKIRERNGTLDAEIIYALRRETPEQREARKARDFDRDFKIETTRLVTIAKLEAEAQFNNPPLTSPLPVVQSPNNGKRWTSEALAELADYRSTHSTKDAATHFGISMARVRQLLPSEKPKPKGYSAFNHHSK